MADKYANFAELARGESATAYDISYCYTGSPTIIVAPHGGGIEPGTSELCLQIAGSDLSWYRFEGRKSAGNGDLHITSSNFDEPQCIAMIDASRRVVTVHGEGSEADVVYIGGLHEATIERLRTALEDVGFTVRRHTNPGLQGLHPRNICNLGQLREGVQLELSKGFRRSFFAGLSAVGRRETTERFVRFCDAVRLGLERAPA